MTDDKKVKKKRRGKIACGSCVCWEKDAHSLHGHCDCVIIHKGRDSGNKWWLPPCPSWPNTYPEESCTMYRKKEKKS